jgi:hypothetical protein
MMLGMRRPNPMLALIGAIVIIDAIFPETITTVLRRNRAEAYIGITWLALHVSHNDQEK